MANYITRPGGHDTTYRGPYTSDGAHLRIYVLDATYARLHATLDRYLNAAAPPGRHYLPLADRVVACFAAMEHVAGADLDLGFMREIDVAFFIPAVRFEGLIPHQIVFFAPYLFVDIPQAQATGREVHGYRKDLGTSFSDVDTYADGWQANAADLTHIDAWAVRVSGDRLRRRRLVDVTVPAGQPGRTPWADAAAALLEIFEALAGEAERVIEAAATILGAGNLVAGGLRQKFEELLLGHEVSVPIVFLRQFRDRYDSAQPDFQEVLQANTRVPLAQLAGHKVDGDYAVTFHDTASHPFSIELGIPTDVAVRASLTIEATCSFTLEHAS